MLNLKATQKTAPKTNQADDSNPTPLEQMPYFAEIAATSSGSASPNSEINQYLIDNKILPERLCSPRFDAEIINLADELTIIKEALELDNQYITWHPTYFMCIVPAGFLALSIWYFCTVMSTDCNFEKYGQITQRNGKFEIQSDELLCAVAEACHANYDTLQAANEAILNHNTGCLEHDITGVLAFIVVVTLVAGLCVVLINQEKHMMYKPKHDDAEMQAPPYLSHFDFAEATQHQRLETSLRYLHDSLTASVESDNIEAYSPFVIQVIKNLILHIKWANEGSDYWFSSTQATSRIINKLIKTINQFSKIKILKGSQAQYADTFFKPRSSSQDNLNLNIPEGQSSQSASAFNNTNSSGESLTNTIEPDTNASYQSHYKYL